MAKLAAHGHLSTLVKCIHLRSDSFIADKALTPAMMLNRQRHKQQANPEPVPLKFAIHTYVADTVVNTERNCIRIGAA